VTGQRTGGRCGERTYDLSRVKGDKRPPVGSLDTLISPEGLATPNTIKLATGSPQLKRSETRTFLFERDKNA
jgi:hypothetical protein